jgi:DNA-binding NarL/FixJ family response regulator
VRVIVADDSVLLRRGLEALLTDGGHEVVASLGDADALLTAVVEHHPDVCIVDIRMPPTHTDEGLRAAREIRSRHPQVAVLVLSQFVDGDYVEELLADGNTHVGYLLKDALLDGDEVLTAVRRVGAGGVVVDAGLVSALLAARRPGSPLDKLSPRERDVIQLMAEGRTDRAIADELLIGLKTVQTHTAAIFVKLGLSDDPRSNRRVRAVLAWLRGTAPSG